MEISHVQVFEQWLPRLPPFVAMLLSACVSQSEYDRVVQQNAQRQAELTVLQQEHKWVEAGDGAVGIGWRFLQRRSMAGRREAA